MRTLLAALLALTGISGMSARAAEPLFTFSVDTLKDVAGPGTPAIKDGFAVFDGASAVYTYPEARPLPARFTFMAWCRPERQTARSASVLCKTGWHTQLGLYQNGAPFFNTFTDADKLISVKGTPMPTGQWVHLAGVYDGENLLLYVDGEPIGFSSVSSALRRNTGLYRVGCANPRSAATAGHFSGAIDGARVWETALSAGEIKKYYVDERNAHARGDGSDAP